MTKRSDQTSLLKSVTDSIADGVVVVDEQGLLVLVNSAAQRMNLPYLKPGRPLAEQAINARMRDSAGRLLRLDKVPIARALQGETLVDYEIILRQPDGSDAYLSTSAGPLKDDKGQITGAIGVYRNITERKKDEQRLMALLRQVEAQQRLTLTIADGIPASIVYTDAELNILWTNRRARGRLGVRAEELTGRNLFEAIPGLEEIIGGPVRSVMARRKAETYLELPFAVPGRKTMFANLYLVPVIEDSRTAGLLMMGVDVTPEVEGRRRAEALVQSWKALVDAAHSVLQELSMDRLAQAVVDQAREVTKADHVALWLADPARRTLNMVAYHNLSEATVALSRRFSYETPSLVVRALLSGEIQEVENILEADSELAISAQVARTEGFRGLLAVPLQARGRVVGSMALGRKEPYRLTEQDRETLNTMAGIFAAALLNAQLFEETEDLARQSQDRASELEAVLQSITDAVFVVDRLGRIKMKNGTATALMREIEGYERITTMFDFADAVKCKYLTGELIPRAELAVSRALRGEAVPDMDEMITDPRTGKTLYALSSAAPIRDEAGKVTGAVCTMRDITRIREIERLRDEFLSTAAHELKTPITVLKGYAQALLRVPEPLPPKIARALDAIDRQTTKLSRLVNDLLDISRLMAGRIQVRQEPVDLAALLAEAIDRMAITTSRHRLNLAVDAHPIVLGEQDKLEQVIVNLLDNAIKYSPAGGDVDVRAYEENGKAVVSVRDYGVGIPADRQEHIFERFYRAHAGSPFDYGGMGVGLFIAGEIVAHHGGRIWFESNEGQGSTFYFSLPLSRVQGKELRGHGTHDR